MSDKAAPAPETSEALPPPAASSFGDDDLGRLQGILIGDHARRTTERIDTLEQALLGAIADLRSTVTDEVTALNKRLDAEQDTRAKALTNLTERVKTEAKERAAETKRLERSLETSVATFEEHVEAIAQNARVDTEQARDEFTRELETQTASLRDNGVDRATLAKLLSDTADELRG